MKICKRCAHCNADEAKFCVKCGERLVEQQMSEPQILIETLQCAKCGYKNKIGVKFCGNCGNEFVSDEKNNMNKKNKNYRWIILLFIMIISAIVAVFNWEEIEDIFEKEYYFNAVMHHSQDVDMHGDTITIAIDTNADWLNKDNIVINIIRGALGNNIEWQRTDGSYTEYLEGHKYAFAPVAEVKFIDDRHVEVTIDKNRGYNRKFRIVVGTSDWGKSSDEIRGHPPVYKTVGFDLYQKGYEGTYRISK